MFVPRLPREKWVAGVFTACLLFFLYRGPYRAIRFSTTGDFSTVYAASRSWLHGTNPYDRVVLKAELNTAGAPSHLLRDQDVNPSVYLPSAFPLTALVAWLPWRAANALWCFLLVTLFGWSLWELVRQLPLSTPSRWLTTSAALLFSPTYVGVYDGNPSVLVISFLVLSICFAVQGKSWKSGLLLGLALCFKPQLGICALALFALWRFGKPLVAGSLFFLAITIGGVLLASQLGQNWTWWHSEQQNVANSFVKGGQSDSSPESAVGWQMLNAQALTSYWVADPKPANWAAWMLVAALGTLYFAARYFNGEKNWWRDVAILSSLTLAITYHRYYDAQLLLLAIPLIIGLWREQLYTPAAGLLISLITLAFPLQTVFARWLGHEALHRSLTQAVLLRFQPAAVLALAIFVCFSFSRNRATPNSCSIEDR